MSSSAAPAQDDIDLFLSRFEPQGKFLSGLKSLTADEVLGDIGTMTLTFINAAGFPQLANREQLLEIWRRLR